MVKKTTTDITKIVKNKSLILPSQVKIVLDYLKEHKINELDMKKVENFSSGFAVCLIHEYNKSVKFRRFEKLLFFNVKNPIWVYKIQEAQFNFFDKETAKKYIKIHDKILNNIINS